MNKRTKAWSNQIGKEIRRYHAVTIADAQELREYLDKEKQNGIDDGTETPKQIQQDAGTIPTQAGDEILRDDC